MRSRRWEYDIYMKRSRDLQEDRIGSKWLISTSKVHDIYMKIAWGWDLECIRPTWTKQETYIKEESMWSRWNDLEREWI